MNKLINKVNVISLVISGTFSLSAIFLIFIKYFQNYHLSSKRVLAGLVVWGVLVLVGYFFNKKIYSNKQIGDNNYRSLVFFGIISLLLIPFGLPVPHYPIATYFQHVSNIQIAVHANDTNFRPVKLRGVWLEMNNKKISSSSFTLSGDWIEDSGDFFLEPGTTGNLIWHGPVSELVKLRIFPMDGNVDINIMWDGEIKNILLSDETFVYPKKNLTPEWYYLSILVSQYLFFAYILFVFFSFIEPLQISSKNSYLIFATIFFLTFYTVNKHFQSPDIVEKFELQINYHKSVLSAQAPSPWQYRVLSEWVVEGFVRFFDVLGLNLSYYWVYYLLRLIQNALIFGGAFIYYRKLGFSNYLTILGMIFIAGSLVNSFYKSGFSINTYFDVIFYLISVIFILNFSFGFLPVLMIIASLNRETSGLIPFLALVRVSEFQRHKSAIIFIGLSFLCWLVVFFVLRFVIPADELFIPYGHPPGISLLMYNLSPNWFGLLFRFFGFVPILGILWYYSWPKPLKQFFLVLVPIWVIIHLFASVIAEARLFLVPQIILFIPSFLVMVNWLHSKLGLDYTDV